MKEHFKEQMKGHEPLDQETVDKLAGKTYYSEHQVGDRVGYFMDAEFNADDVCLTLRLVSDRDFDLMEKEFDFLGMKDLFPVVVKKEVVEKRPEIVKALKETFFSFKE